MTDLEHHRQHHSPMLATTVVRPLVNVSPTNEFYDSAIELSVDDYNHLCSYDNNNHHLSTSYSNNKNLIIQHDHCPQKYLNRSTNIGNNNNNTNNSNRNLSDDCWMQHQQSANNSTIQVVSNKSNPTPMAMSILLDRIDTSTSSPSSSSSLAFKSLEMPQLKFFHSSSIGMKSANKSSSMMIGAHQSSLVFGASGEPVMMTSQCHHNQTLLATVLKDQQQQQEQQHQVHRQQQQQQQMASVTKQHYHHRPQQTAQVSNNNSSSNSIQQQQTVLTSSTASTSSPLRSSRSFTTSYCPRPNVTLIRRKSASERLAESKSKYIRIPSVTVNDASDDNVCGNADIIASIQKVDLQPDTTDASNDNSSNKQQTYPMKLIEETSSSTTKSSSSIQSVGLYNSPATDINDHRTTPSTTNTNISNDSLVSKINSHLNKIKTNNNNNINNINNLVKKRISPKISENSNGGTTMSVLELQLRELIGLEDPNEEMAQNSQMRLPNQSIMPSINNDDRGIYRAELKYIGSSSSSSSCSSFSEPYNVSCSPEKMKRNKTSMSPEQRFPKCSIQPSVDDQQNYQNLSSIVRSKSDVSCSFEKSNRFKSNDDLGRLLESLCLDSNQMNEEKTVNKKLLSKNNLRNSGYLLPANCKSSSSSNDDFSSLDSSTQFSVDESFQKRRNQCGSTSQLTFENLMLHQQNLASSRSCNNIMASFHHGSSVVERNARIIKWLFNCRKAMDHQSTII